MLRNCGTLARSIDFNRAHAAVSQTFTLQYSTNLTSWMPTAGTTLEVMGSYDLYDWSRLLLPAPAPKAAFFRLERPTAP